MNEREKAEQLRDEATQQIDDRVREGTLPGPVGKTVIRINKKLEIVHEIFLGKNGGWSDIYKSETKQHKLARPIQTELMVVIPISPK